MRFLDSLHSLEMGGGLIFLIAKVFYNFVTEVFISFLLKFFIYNFSLAYGFILYFFNFKFPITSCLFLLNLNYFFILNLASSFLLICNTLYFPSNLYPYPIFKIFCLYILFSFLLQKKAGFWFSPHSCWFYFSNFLLDIRLYHLIRTFFYHQIP